MTLPEKTHVSEALKNNPNYQAYQAALKAGEFEHLQKGAWVAYCEGNLVASAENRDKLFKKLDAQHKKLQGDTFVHEVGTPMEAVDTGSRE